MNKYLTKTDEELLVLVSERIEKLNPRIKIGSFMTAPIHPIHNGRIVELDRVVKEGANIISLDFYVPHYVPPHEIIQAKSIKLSFSDLEALEWSSFPHKYLHPYLVAVPHRKWMLEHKPGDTVLVYDDAFDASPLTLTEEHFTMHEYLIFKFGASD